MDNVVFKWVTTSTRNHKVHGKRINVQIQEYLNSLPAPEDTITVYRGQSPDSPKIDNDRWFSTSEFKEKAFDYAMLGDCCFFIIHVLPGIKRFKIDDILANGRHIKKNWDESEIIVDKGGHFYADADLTIDGFQEITPVVIHKVKTRTFETWYGLPKKVVTKKIEPKRIVSTDELFDRIIPEEYFLYNNVASLKNTEFHLRNNEIATNETWKEVFQKIKNKKGGKWRKTRKVKRRNRRASIA